MKRKKRRSRGVVVVVAAGVLAAVIAVAWKYSGEIALAAARDAQSATAPLGIR